MRKWLFGLLFRKEFNEMETLKKQIDGVCFTIKCPEGIVIKPTEVKVSWAEFDLQAYPDMVIGEGKNFSVSEIK